MEAARQLDNPTLDPCSKLEAKLKSFLISEWQRRKMPVGLRAAWAETSTRANDVTSKVFQAAGFKAWLAFYLATNEAGSHHKGKRSGDAVKNALDQLPSCVLQGIAKKLTETTAHFTTERAIEKMSRQLQLGEDVHCNSVSARASSPTPIAIDIPRATLPIAPATSIPGLTNESVDLNLSTMDMVDAEGQRFANASPQGIMSIFPAYFCGAIRMIGAGAATRGAVAMHFPYQQHGSIHCLMSMNIIPSRLAAVLKDLFDVMLEVQGGMQYIINKGGGRLLPLPHVTIGGASKEGIASVLGDYADRGIETSPERKKELWQAIVLTSCATMTISKDPSEDGQLNLNIGLEEGLIIQRILYPKNRL